MDPNATLDRIYEAIGNWERYRSSDHADELVEAILALDGWLTNGGFLPRDWNRKYTTSGHRVCTCDDCETGKPQ